MARPRCTGDAPLDAAPGARRGLLGVVGVSLLAVAIVLATVERPVDATPDVRSTATVTAVAPEWSGVTGRWVWVTIEFAFVDSSGVARTGSFPSRPAVRYSVGSTIDIAYPVGRPDDADVVDASGGSTPLPWALLVPFGVAALASGVVVLSRRRWMSATLRDNPWVLATSAAIERPVRMLELMGAPDEHGVLAAPVSWRAVLVEPFAPVAWVAGSDRRFLVAAPGGGSVTRFRRVRLLDDPLQGFDVPTLHTRLADDG